MIRRRLKDFFSSRTNAGVVYDILNSEELTLITRFLTTRDKEMREYLAAELMERTLINLSPKFPIFHRLFNSESQKVSSMEKGIVYMKENYRSHFVHSVYTYLLGFFLFKDRLLGKRFLNHLNLSYYDTHYKDFPTFEQLTFPEKYEGKEFQKRWALTAFFHDLAYLSEVNLKVMQEEGKRLTNIEHPYSLKINDLQTFLNQPILTRLRNDLKMSFAPEYLFREDVLEILSCRMVNRLGMFSTSLIYQSLKEIITKGLHNGYFDHGAIGAIFLLRSFYYMLFECYIEDNKSAFLLQLDKLSINHNIIRFTDAMTAVCLHNIKNFDAGIFRKELKVKINNRKLPLAFLLILCDELQTWDREMEPPKNYTQQKIIRRIKRKEVDKNIFLEHFRELYRDCGNAFERERLDNDSQGKIIKFVIPFWKEKEEKKEQEGKEEKKCGNRLYKNKMLKIDNKDSTTTEVHYKIFKINNEEGTTSEVHFEKKKFHLLHEALEQLDKGSIDYQIQKKNYNRMEKESWKIFSKDHNTLSQLISVALAFNKFLSLHAKDPHAENSGSPPYHSTIIKGLECLSEDLYPPLKNLIKRQDKLFRYLRPNHFHDIDLEKSLNKEKRAEDCILLLQYPGEEITKIETVVKKRLEYVSKKEDKKELMDSLKIETVLNRMINQLLPEIENSIHAIQRGELKVIKHRCD